MGTLDLSPRDILKRELTDPASPASAALSATYAQQWKPATTYLSGQPVVNPSGDIVTAKADHTSGSSFTAANWNAAPSVAAKLESTRDSGDTFQSLTRRITVPDIAGSKGSVINIDHRGDGTGNTANPGQTYGIDLHNYPGAVSAFVGHQYSSVAPFLWLDNTDNQPLIRLHNTQNTTLNPGRDGTGDFFQFQDHGTEIMRITKDLVFSTLNGTKTMTILNTVAKAFSVQQASSYAGSGHAMEVIKLATGSGSALDVTNAGSGKGVYIRQNGAATALQIDAAAAAAGLYPVVVSGQDYGPSITTATDGGVSLNVSKNGTGAGDVVKITNKGTGNALSIHNSAGTRIARIGKNGSIVTANGTAPVLADMADGETALWRDATTGDLKVTSRVSGALKTATLAVA